MAKNLILWLIIATVLLTVFKQLDTPVSNQEIAYSQFIQLVQSGQIKKVTISGAAIDGEFSNGQLFETIRPGHDPKMMDDLLEHNFEEQGKKH
jgi:cell division protease FtsH